MAEFGIVDLTVPTPPNQEATSPVGGQGAGGWLGTVDTAVVAAALESLRQDLSGHIKAEKTGLRMSSLTIKLTLGAEGKVAFVAKGTAEACIEVVFAVPPPKAS